MLSPIVQWNIVMDLIMRDSSLFVCLAIDLVWQVSNISIINVSVFYPDPIINGSLLLSLFDK